MLSPHCQKVIMISRNTVNLDKIYVPNLPIYAEQGFLWYLRIEIREVLFGHHVPQGLKCGRSSNSGLRMLSNWSLSNSDPGNPGTRVADSATHTLDSGQVAWPSPLKEIRRRWVPRKFFEELRKCWLCSLAESDPTALDSDLCDARLLGMI